MKLKVEGSGGRTYEVDTEELTCTCANFMYSRRNFSKDNPQRLCKHLNQVFSEHPEWMPDGLRRLEDEIELSMESELRGDGMPRPIYFSNYSVINKIFSDLNWTFSVTGEYRRNLPKVKRLEFIVTREDFAKDVSSIDGLLKLCKITTNVLSDHIVELVMDGFKRGFLYVVPKEEYVTQLFYTTGPKNEVLRLQEKAESLGYTLKSDGLFQNEERIPLNSERDLYEKLNLNYVHEFDR